MLSLSDNTQADVDEAFGSTSSYLDDLVNIDNSYLELEQQSMVHHRKYPLFYLLPLPWGQGHTKCSSVPST